MNVAFLTTSFPRFSGDYAGIFVYDLARALVARGVKVHVLAPHTAGAPQQEVIEGIEVTRFRYFLPNRAQRLAYGAGIPTNLRNDWRVRFQILPFAVSFSLHMRKVIAACDVVHAHWIEPAFLALPWTRIYGKPLIVSVHRYNPSGRMGKAIYRRALAAADAVLLNSSFTQGRCLRDVTPKLHKVIPPGIDIGRFLSRWETERSSGEETRSIVFALGSLLPVKGFIHLVEAMPYVLDRVSCDFVIGGQGPLRDLLLARAKELGVDYRLKLLGRVSTEDVPRLMREADVFVLPSVPHPSGDNEALGMVLVEALASGTPCVASNTGGIPDVIEDGVNGFLVPPGESVVLAKRIVFLLEDGQLRQRMGRAGRRKVEQQFSLTPIADDIISVYESLSPS